MRQLRALLHDSGSDILYVMVVLVVTLATGIIAVVGLLFSLYHGRRKLTGRLAFIKHQSISPHTDLVEVFDHLEISFEDRPVTSDTLFVKGCIANTGREDVREEDLKSPVTLTLPAGRRWREFKITSATRGVEPDHSQDSDTVVALRWKLLKIDESIEFQAVVDKAPDAPADTEDSEATEADILDLVDVEYRIPNFGPIRVLKAPESGQPRMASIAVVSALMFTYAIVLWIIIGISPASLRYTMHFEIAGTDDEVVQGRLSVASDSSLDIHTNEGRERIGIEDFTEQWSIGRPVIVQNKFSYRTLFVSAAVLSLFGLIGIVASCLVWQQKRKLHSWGFPSWEGIKRRKNERPPNHGIG